MNFFRILFFNCIFAIGDTAVNLMLSSKNAVVIRSGPFAGMRWGTRAVGSELPPKLMGTYEKELTPVMERFPEFDLVIDIGAAEGWYAVGLLYRKMARKVIAFEAEETGRNACGENAERNGVADCLEIRGACGAEELQRLLDSLPQKNFRVLIISDCEGYEEQLFNTKTLPLCRQAYLLIETHELLAPGATVRLTRELDPSHWVTEIRPVRRSRSDAERPGKPTPWWLRVSAIRRFMLVERRGPGNFWLCAAPKTETK